ncbi:MAG: hypothetical protein OTJ43_06260 [Dehalococcoidia bacterium]|nr:hypothetical protein [Dehalococcoidia bacterium]
MTLSQARRNQLVIAAISSALLTTLWAIGDLPGSMNTALPFVIAALWIPVFLSRKQRDGGVLWNSLFGILGIAVVSVVVRVVWLIGRG